MSTNSWADDSSSADVDYYDSCIRRIMTVDATACNTELKDLDLLLFEYVSINGNGNDVSTAMATTSSL